MTPVSSGKDGARGGGGGILFRGFFSYAREKKSLAHIIIVTSSVGPKT